MKFQICPILNTQTSQLTEPAECWKQLELSLSTASAGVRAGILPQPGGGGVGAGGDVRPHPSPPPHPPHGPGGPHPRPHWCVTGVCGGTETTPGGAPGRLPPMDVQLVVRSLRVGGGGG